MENLFSFPKVMCKFSDLKVGEVFRPTYSNNIYCVKVFDKAPKLSSGKNFDNTTSFYVFDFSAHKFCVSMKSYHADDIVEKVSPDATLTFISEYIEAQHRIRARG